MTVSDAFATYILTLMGNRPRELAAMNSRAALQDRACSIEAHIQAFATFIAAEIEDTASHVCLSRRTSDYAVAVLSDLASDVRGELVQAIDGVVTKGNAA